MQSSTKDGSTIHYWRQGLGEPLICIGGSLDDGAENQPLAEALSAGFDVINYTDVVWGPPQIALEVA